MNHRPRCHRPKCRRTTNGHTYCSAICRNTSECLAAAHRALAELGHTEATDNLIESAEELNSALTRHADQEWNLRKLALEAGWTSREFNGLLRGDIAVQHSTG
jgi:hypothetical protein